MEKLKLLPLNLQFFADGAEADNSDAENTDNGGAEDNNKNDVVDKAEKTFTQSQVNKMMSREKKEGRSALLNSLGFKSEDEAKKAVDLYKTLINSQKSDDEKHKDELSESNNKLSEAEKRAVDAENKLDCLMAGVNKESVDDVLAIASVKVDDDNDLKKVLENMRSQAKYAVFFETEESLKDTGTGHDTSHSRQKSDAKKGSYGASLANGANKAVTKKSSYFNS